ncbi:hypothetical protein [Nocardioides alkalitolerans]|uniref:hypothetical protein n=1 Tax=Nocardioides alkalitolerans TaxID=281714 RepID=UPI00040E35B2|nr:hypothetical protein [Nocardioides alkalitolerans]
MNTTENQPTGADLIAAERQRQIEAEGYTPEHDDEHDDEHGWQTLWAAGATYAEIGHVSWPWRVEEFKPTNVVRDLIKAGALAQAAMEVAERASIESVYCYPAKNLRKYCANQLDSILDGVRDLGLIR